ncbi:hypothetical protein K438DRAFT_1144392 [Mycena galopus ATCC 62051]|nr:hypothetical protein K438DRAFT_1144392 [Mycena galopus ATCC 62051]
MRPAGRVAEERDPLVGPVIRKAKCVIASFTQYPVCSPLMRPSAMSFWSMLEFAYAWYFSCGLSDPPNLSTWVHYSDCKDLISKLFLSPLNRMCREDKNKKRKYSKNTDLGTSPELTRATLIVRGIRDAQQVDEIWESGSWLSPRLTCSSTNQRRGQLFIRESIPLRPSFVRICLLFWWKGFIDLPANLWPRGSGCGCSSILRKMGTTILGTQPPTCLLNSSKRPRIGTVF